MESTASDAQTMAKLDEEEAKRQKRAVLRELNVKHAGQGSWLITVCCAQWAEQCSRVHEEFGLILEAQHNIYKAAQAVPRHREP